MKCQKDMEMMKVGNWILESQGFVERKQSMSKMIIVATIVATILFSVCISFAQAQELTASYYSRASLIKEGTASYNPKFIMANGKVFYDESAVCAFNSYPLGAILRVTTADGKSVVVVNSDRTAKRFTGKRIDLSISAMRQIDGVRKGLVPVSVKEVL